MNSPVEVKKNGLPIGLYAIGLGGVAIGLTEFAIAGLLPIISHDLHVSTAKSGYWYLAMQRRWLSAELFLPHF